MKDEFFGFYDPTIEEIDKSWKDGIFIFDANALLNLYRYSDSTRNDFLLALNKLSEKIFMPYQVGLEYHSNRLIVIEGLLNAYFSINNDILELFENLFTDKLNKFKRHPSIDIENIQKIKDEFVEKLKDELDKQKKTHPNFADNDNILTQLTEIYKNKVGKPFTKEELQNIYSEGKSRYDQQIPPGYKDLETKKKKGEQHIYGDYIIWKEIISKTSKEKKPVIFVTDDRKEDWWKIENGKTIRPREELIKEFHDLTGIRILIYTADSFLHFAKKRKLVSQIKDTSINEVKEVRKSDESYLKLSDILNGNNFHNLSGTTSIPDTWKEIQKISNPTASLLYSDTFKTLQQLSNPTASLLHSDTLKTIQELSNPTASLLYSDTFKTLQQLSNPTASLLHSDTLKAIRGIVNQNASLLNSDTLKAIQRFSDSIAINTLNNIPPDIKPEEKKSKILGNEKKKTLAESEKKPFKNTGKKL